MTMVNIDGSDSPLFEVVENGENTKILIAVPGLRGEDIKVWTSGTLLFIETHISDSDSADDGLVRVGGDAITSNFKMEFIIDTSATVGGPYIYRGVLTIPIRTNPEILANVREFTVREMTKSEAEVVKRGDDTSIFKDSYK